MDTPRKITEEDIQFYLDTLAQGSRDDRTFALRNLARFPTGDGRVRAALEPLLAETTPCLLQIPFRFGEMRLLAGVALAAERWQTGDDRPVLLTCAETLTPDELEARRLESGVDAPPYPGDPTEFWLALFARLRDHAALAEVHLELRHPVFIGWL